MIEEYITYYHSPIGIIEIIGNEIGIIKVDFINEVKEKRENEIVLNCVHQLDEYFNGKRQQFELNLIINGTEFQKKIWNSLLTIPFGKTATYQDVACKINNWQ